MKPLRRIAAFFALALALALGQQAGLLHAFGHGSDRAVQTQDGKPSSAPCEQCGLAAHLDGLASTPPPVLAIPGTTVLASPLHSYVAPVRAPVVFRSRAPPLLS